MFVDRLKKAVGERMKARLFIIPNLNDGRIGKRSELLIWDNARDTFSNYGYVTELKGIQLTENLNPKPKKKKKAQPSDEASQDSNENQNKEPE